MAKAPRPAPTRTSGRRATNAQAPAPDIAAQPERPTEPLAKSITSLADLTPDPANARKHNPRNVGMIRDALGEVGAARSIVIDEAGVVLAGNATVEAAADAGMSRVQVVDADGETIIAVRRTGLTPEQKARLALYDNRTAELADWDADVLKRLQGEGVDLSKLWDEAGLLEVLKQVPDFAPVGEDEQGRLDQKAPVTCPECGHEFVPKG